MRHDASQDLPDLLGVPGKPRMQPGRRSGPLLVSATQYTESGHGLQ